MSGNIFIEILAVMWHAIAASKILLNTSSLRPSSILQSIGNIATILCLKKKIYH